jgi:hypothetical protein
MDLQTRKIAFVQEFLSIQSEEIVSRLEKSLKNEKIEIKDKSFKPMTTEELNRRIDQSEQDSINGRLTESKDLLKKIKKWT